MGFNLEPMTLILTGLFWFLVLGLIWYVPYGFSQIKDKIIFSILALPCIYLMVAMQMNR